MQRSSIIAVGSANTVTTKDGNKELKLAKINKRDDCAEKQDRICRSAGD
jgi:hypothetical protein